MQALKHVFNIIDADGDGDVDRKDLLIAFRLLGLTSELTVKDLDVIFEDCDDGNHDEAGRWQPVLKMGPFTTMVFETKLPCLRSFVTKSRKYREMFTVFDRDNTGFMNAEELGSTLTKLPIRSVLTPIRTISTPFLTLGSTITKLFGWRPTRYESEKLLATVDQDGGGVIDFGEFVNMLHFAQSPALAKVTSPFGRDLVIFYFDLPPSLASRGSQPAHPCQCCACVG